MTRVPTGRYFSLRAGHSPFECVPATRLPTRDRGCAHQILPARKYPILMVTIHSFTEGKCIWCRQTTEGVQFQFQDGLKGFLCKRDFWSALKARTEETPPASPATEPTPAPTPPRRPS